MGRVEGILDKERMFADPWGRERFDITPTEAEEPWKAETGNKMEKHGSSPFWRVSDAR